MGTPYTGSASNVSLGSAVQATVPADGDADAAATFTVGTQKLADYIEACRILLQTASLPMFESFDGVTFPPTSPIPGAWSTSATPWIRTTSGPLSGAGSASAPTPQTASTQTQLSWSFFSPCPFRLAFYFKVKGNTNDGLNFAIDGGTANGGGTIKSNAGPTTESGCFVTPLAVSEGFHTFTWTWNRGGSASVAGETCMIDSVCIIPDSLFFATASSRSDVNGIRGSTFSSFYDEFVYTALPSSWTQRSGANAGTVGAINSQTLTGNGSPRIGILEVRTAAVAATDWTSIQMDPILGFGAAAVHICALNNRPFFVEFDCGVPSVTNIMFSLGLVGAADVLGNGTERVDILYDSALGTNWRIRTVTGGVATIIDTGVVAATGTHQIAMGSGAGFGWTFYFDGTLIGTSNANVAAAMGYSPVAHVESRVAAQQNKLQVDALRILYGYQKLA